VPRYVVEIIACGVSRLNAKRHPDRNSVDFIYWFNGEGMAEFLIEQASQKLSLPRFQKQESVNQKPRR
jgi:hypothetical protein